MPEGLTQTKTPTFSETRPEIDRNGGPRYFGMVAGFTSEYLAGINRNPHASVSDTNVWQLAVLPRDEAYCAATPTERSPFFGNAVSSMTSTASSPPTSRSA